ncbi:MAG TPA: hypothetical protein VM618_08205, partial [Acidimicrobiia bacterium]|nr:hypothetical protein [Acidimicrobiia bacterium]
MDVVIAVVVAVAIVALVVYAAMRARLPEGEAGRAVPFEVVEGTAVVVLDVDAEPPPTAALRRLAADAAARVFAARPDVDEVEIHSSAGVVLDRFERREPRVVDIRDDLFDPHRPTRSGPTATPDRDAPSVRRPGVAVPESPPPVPVRPLADRFELPDAVAARLDDRDDPVALVAA